jgi:hypothetical protein
LRSRMPVKPLIRSWFVAVSMKCCSTSESIQYLHCWGTARPMNVIVAGGLHTAGMAERESDCGTGAKLESSRTALS